MAISRCKKLQSLGVENVLKTVCAQERARAKRKAIFELRAAAIVKNKIQLRVMPKTKQSSL